MNLILYNKKSNCIVVTKTSGYFTFNSFKTIQCIINQNKKLYKKIWFKKIPKLNYPIKLKYLDIILEFLILTNLSNLLKIIKSITYKITFKLKVFYLKR